MFDLLTQQSKYHVWPLLAPFTRSGLHVIPECWRSQPLRVSAFARSVFDQGTDGASDKYRKADANMSPSPYTAIA